MLLSSPSPLPSQAYPTKDVKLCNTEAPGYNYLVYQGNSTHPYQFDAPIYDDKTDNKCIQKSLDIVLNGVNATWDLSSSTFACVRQETCVSTRFAAILHAFFYNIWCAHWHGHPPTTRGLASLFLTLTHPSLPALRFFGAIYYWANWGFILIFFIALFYLTCKRRRSLVASLIKYVGRAAQRRVCCRGWCGARQVSISSDSLPISLAPPAAMQSTTLTTRMTT